MRRQVRQQDAYPQTRKGGGQLQLCATPPPTFTKSNISLADCRPLSSLL